MPHTPPGCNVIYNRRHRLTSATRSPGELARCAIHNRSVVCGEDTAAGSGRDLEAAKYYGRQQCWLHFPNGTADVRRAHRHIAACNSDSSDGRENAAQLAVWSRRSRS